ncbi:uncharacterized protein LOC110467217 [Mizuhopecten yessoensis]|uniref:uncharacterized protein LOC110467217 n=1 Tax=Mizuhopecten yessoensis TaxID=6573 RepID=UPI000B4592AF|nr:uncharacterized protein LOC110467217 [Mizuhopecten yessoensis]
MNTVLLGPVWSEVEDMKGHPLLCEAASKLESVLKASHASSTDKQYCSNFAKFKDWCRITGLGYLPSRSSTVAVYLSYLVQQSVSVSTLNSHFYSIKWQHDFADLPNPCTDKFVLKSLEGAKRILSKPIFKKSPISVEHIESIFRKYGNSENVKDLRLCTLCILGFAGFFRFSELVDLKMSNCVLKSSHLEITLVHSKTDVYRQGNVVVIAKTGKKTCPVACFVKYITAAGLSFGADSYIFRAVSFCKSTGTYKLCSRNQALSYTRVREIFLGAISEIGLKKSEFGLHSLRAGGATIAANNGISERLFKAHGRWASEKAKDGYVLDDLDHKISVSANLGI